MTPEQLIEKAADLFAVDRALILSPSRAAPVVEARNAAIWALRKSGWTLEAIGALFDRDYTTVRHSLISVKDRVVQDKAYLAKLDQLRIDVRPVVRRRAAPLRLHLRVRMSALEARIAALESALLERRAA